MSGIICLTYLPKTKFIQNLTTLNVLGEILFAPLDLVQDMFFGILGMGLFSVSGGLVLSARLKWSPIPRTGDHTMALLAGSLAIGNAVLMLIDLSLAYLDTDEYDDEASV